MANELSVNQHLEMMIQKRSRCEDWVASVALQKQDSILKEKRIDEYIGVDYFDEYSDRSLTDGSVKRRQRKAINSLKLSLDLVCEWHGCNFSKTSVQSLYFQHMNCHADRLVISENAFQMESYECQWESCNFETTEKCQMTRHIAHHGYHSLLKAAASKLHQLWEFSPCRLENENKNLLPDLPRPFECGAASCDFTSNYYLSYLNHINEHLLDLKFGSENPGQAECFWKACPFKCRTFTRMKTHVRVHTGEKVVACSTCGAMFATNTKYMDHCTRKTPVLDEANRCQYCLRYFSNERLLRDHLRYHINRHKCPFCEIICSTPAVLANHVRYKHMKDRPFKCGECSFRSVKADDCISHMSTHDADPKYKCQAEGCTFACAALQTFNNHFRSAHLMVDGPVYCCHLCDKKYKRGTLLGKHLRAIHELERPPGHSRFRYMEGIDGNYRLQIERYESIDADSVDYRYPDADEELPNFVVKYEPTDEKSCPKFTVTVDECDGSDQGALIAIDEIDEVGRVVRTSTVREKLVQLPSTDVVFVDVDAKLPNPKVTNGEENISPRGKLSSSAESHDKPKLTPPSSKPSTRLYHFTIKRRKTCRAVLSDADTSRNEISCTNE